MPDATVESADVRTTGVYADFEIHSRTQGQASAEATLRTGSASSNTYLVLRGNDRLSVLVGGSSYPMSDTGTGSAGQKYGTSFPVPTDAVEVRILFQRGAEDKSATESSVLLPPDFFVLPFPRRAYSRVQDLLEANWAPFDPSMSVDLAVSGECFAQVSRNQADSGAMLLLPGALRPTCDPKCSARDAEKPTSCTATFAVTKSRDGHVDPTFAGGSFHATLQRSDTFVSTP